MANLQPSGKRLQIISLRACILSSLAVLEAKRYQVTDDMDSASRWMAVAMKFTNLSTFLIQCTIQNRDAIPIGKLYSVLQCSTQYSNQDTASYFWPLENVLLRFLTTVTYFQPYFWTKDKVSKDFLVLVKNLFQRSGPLIDISNLFFLSFGQLASNSILKNYWDKNEMVFGSMDGIPRKQF